MKKALSLTLSISALMFAFTVHAADESNWYLGAQYSAQEVTSLPDRELNTFGIVAGYQYNQFFALETRLNIGTSGYSSSFGANGDVYKEDIDTQASLFIKASYPIYDSFSIFVLAGVSKSKYEITTTLGHTDIDGNYTETYPHIIKESESGFNYGLGLNYQITESVNVFIDYQVLPELTVTPGNSHSWKSTSIGVNYSF